MFARTERLTLRPGWPEDAVAMTAAIAHPEVAMRLARLPWPYAQADAETFLALPRGAHEARFLILSHEHAYPALVGGVGLRSDGDAHELGYWLTPAAWGRGYATEAARAVLHMARHALPVRRIVAHHHLDNPASGHVLRKLGFVETGRTRLPSLAQRRAVECGAWALDLVADDIARMPIAA